jgi:hypothetical protein
MSNWSNNNRAHASLWFFEVYHQGNEVPFAKAGNWKTSYLIGVVPGDSSAMVNQKAKAHAVLLDEVFTKLYRATYEPGISQIDATDGMEVVLQDPGKLITDLAAVVDEKYKFIGEI